VALYVFEAMPGASTASYKEVSTSERPLTFRHFDPSTLGPSTYDPSTLCVLCYDEPVLTLTALALGFVHGLGADHLMAIAALSVRGGRTRTIALRQPFEVAVRFALGHALLLFLGAAAVLVLGWQIPEIVEHSGERVGGALLIAMGMFTLWVVASERLYGHSHEHGHHAAHASADHVHWHFHFGRRDAHPGPQAHSHGAGVLGAVFAVSGLRALTLLAPALHGQASPSLVTLLYLVLIFAVGILLSMSLFGIVLSRVLGIPWIVRTVGRGAAALTAVASIVLGVYWIMG
jgi:nickel/cobalt exporter